jgi:hypothetical protein
LAAIALLWSCCGSGRDIDGGADPRHLVAQLSLPTKEGAACASLVALGAGAVPALRGYLAGEPADQIAERPAAFAVHALGRIGVDAADAQPEVQSLFRLHPSVDVRRQAAWTLARIVAPTRDAQRCRDCEKFLRDLGSPDIDQGTYRWSLALLALGRDSGEAAVTQMLQLGSADEIAALAEAIACGWCDSAVARADFSSRMGLLRAQGYRTWDRNSRHETAWAAMAWACWQHGDTSPEAALGLLRHQEAEWRIAGLEAIATSERWQDKAEVLALLDDPVPAVQQQAITTVKSWGPSLMALPRLRAIAARHPTLAADCATAADDIVRAVTASANETAVLDVRSADAMLRGDPIQLVPSTDAGSHTAWIDLVRGSRDASAAWIAAVGAVAPSIADDADGADAFVSLLASTAQDSWNAAITAIARCGPTLLRTHPDIEATIFECGGRAGPAFLVGMELRAGALASDADLAIAEADGAWHLVARARLERVLRRTTIPPEAIRRARAGMSGSTASVGQRIAWADLRSSGTSSVSLLAEPALVRPAAALLLAAAGETGWRDTVAPEAAQLLAEATVEGRLPELSERWIRELQEWVRAQ